MQQPWEKISNSPETFRFSQRQISSESSESINKAKLGLQDVQLFVV
jgi:hypothetical protein